MSVVAFHRILHTFSRSEFFLPIFTLGECSISYVSINLYQLSTKYSLSAYAPASTFGDICPQLAIGALKIKTNATIQLRIRANDMNEPLAP